jgi:hypothetical protein
MIAKKVINFIIVTLCLCLVTGVGVFIYNAENTYRMQ